MSTTSLSLDSEGITAIVSPDRKSVHVLLLDEHMEITRTIEMAPWVAEAFAAQLARCARQACDVRVEQQFSDGEVKRVLIRTGVALLPDTRALPIDQAPPGARAHVRFELANCEVTLIEGEREVKRMEPRPGIEPPTIILRHDAAYQIRVDRCLDDSAMADLMIEWEFLPPPVEGIEP